MSNNDLRGQNPTASRPDRIAQCITGPSTRATRIVEDYDHQQGAAIFATHGVADAATTVYATNQLGAGVEANPIMAQLLHIDPALAAITMLAITAAVAIAYPRVAQINGVHRHFGTAVAAVGALVAIVNVIVGVTA